LQTVQNLRNILGAAIDDLQLTDAIIRIAYALAQFSPLIAERIGDRHPGGIVGRTVDPVPGGQPVDGGLLEVAVDGQILLAVQGSNIGLNRKHFRFSPLTLSRFCCRLLSSCYRRLFLLSLALSTFWQGLY